MSGLRELALERLRELGQRAGRDAGQQVSHAAPPTEAPWDSRNGGFLREIDGCPGVPSPNARDSGTRTLEAGQQAGREAGQQALPHPRLADALHREWRARLAVLHELGAPKGFDRLRWANLCDDAVFVLGGFGEQAARDGWSTADLFGLWPDKSGWGGVVDRLRGSRSLVMTADTACWRRVVGDSTEQFNRGSYPDLRPFWEWGA